MMMLITVITISAALCCVTLYTDRVSELLFWKLGLADITFGDNEYHE